MLALSKRMSPSTRTLSTRSLSRLKQRNNVDLPQPDGPMNAVTCFSGMVSEIRLMAREPPYQSDRASTSSTVRGAAVAATAWAGCSSAVGAPSASGAAVRSSGGTTFMSAPYSGFAAIFEIGGCTAAVRGSGLGVERPDPKPRTPNPHFDQMPSPVLLDTRSYRAPRVARAQAVAEDDRHQIHHHHYQHQQQRGGEDQRLGRLDVRALKADVVDVKAEVHELAFEMNEREAPIDGQRRRQ